MPLSESLKRSADSAEFVTTAEMQTFVRASTTGNNAELATLVQSAREQVEKDTRRAYLAQTWVYKCDQFPRNREYLELHRPPLLSVTSLQYIDSDGNTQTFSSTVEL